MQNCSPMPVFHLDFVFHFPVFFLLQLIYNIILVQVYDVVIQYFYRLYSIQSYYKTMAVFHCAIQYIVFFSFFFFYFWLSWALAAVRGTSLAAASGDHSMLLCTGFSLQWPVLLQNTGSRNMGFSSCSTQAQQLCPTGSRAQAQQLWHSGTAAPRHAESSQTKARTHIPCISRKTPNHCASREVPYNIFFLLIYFIYGSLCLLIPYTYHALPPSISQLVSTSFFFIFVSLLLLCYIYSLVLFFNLIFTLYQSIVDLQCCVSFRCTAK